MKVCPQCRTKYTDDTLKFCLQDGKLLESSDDEKTLVFNQDSIADDETIVDNFSGGTRDLSGKTTAFENQETNANPEKGGNKQYIPIGSRETIPQPKNLVQNSTGDAYQTTNKKSGFGFLTGFLIAVLLVGFVGLGILAIIYLPKILGENANSAEDSNVTKSNVKKDRILNDTNDVKISASSTRKQLSGNLYNPRLAFDGNSRTAWCEGAKGAGKGQWIVFDFANKLTLKKIIIEPGYFKTRRLWSENNRLKVVNLKFSDGTTKSVTFPNEMKLQTINTENIKTKSVMITIKDVYTGQADSNDTLISEVKFAVE